MLLYIFNVTDLNGDGETSLKIEVTNKNNRFIDLIYCDYQTMMNSYINNPFSLYKDSKIIWT